MKTQEGRAYDEASDRQGPAGGAAGKRAPTDGLAAGAATGGAAVPVLQFKPGAGAKAPSSGESYLDSILGTDEDQIHAKGKGTKGTDEEDEAKTPSWAEPGSTEVLPGEPVPLLGPYTEADRVKLKGFLATRSKQNREAVAGFLREFVDASVTIVAKYAMTSVKEKNQLAQFLRWGMTEGLTTLIGGAGGLATRKAFKVLFDVVAKGADFGLGEAMGDDETFEDEKGLGTLIDTVGTEAGSHASAMIKELGADDVELGFWLGQAKPQDFNRFRIPARLEVPPRDTIRGAVAGGVAANHHRRPIGGQMLSGTQWIKPDSVERGDNNVIHVDLTARGGKVTVTSATLGSRNKELEKEIVGKVSIGTLPRVAMHARVTAESEQLPVIHRILAAFDRPSATLSAETIQFFTAYPRTSGPLTFTRDTGGAFASTGGSITEQVAMYQYVTGDQDLRGLAGDIRGTEEDSETKTSRPGDLAIDALAREVYTRLNSNEYGVVGGQMLVSQLINPIVPRS